MLCLLWLWVAIGIYYTKITTPAVLHDQIVLEPHCDSTGGYYYIQKSFSVEYYFKYTEKNFVSSISPSAITHFAINK